MKRKPEKHLPCFTVPEAFQKARGRAMCELEADATPEIHLDALPARRYICI